MEAQNDKEIEHKRYLAQVQMRKEMALEETRANVGILELMRDKKKSYWDQMTSILTGSDVDKTLKAKIKDCKDATVKIIEKELTNDDDERQHMLELAIEVKKRQRVMKDTEHHNEGQLHDETVNQTKAFTRMQIDHARRKRAKDEEMETELFNYELECQESETHNRCQRISIRRALELKQQRNQQLEATKEALGLSSQELRKESGKKLRGNFTKQPHNIPPGDYVLGWMWDCEESSQIWASCSDVR